MSLEILLSSLTLSVGIALIAACFALFLGGIPAHLLHFYKMPNRRILSLFIILPLALPAPLSLGTYLEALGADVFLGITNSWIVSGLIIGASLSPFVFLLQRFRMRELSPQIYDLTRQLGFTKWRKFRVIFFPLLFPTFVFAGLTAFAAALGDFATLQRSGFETLTVLLHRYWFGFFDMDSAAWLGGTLLLIALTIVIPLNLGLIRKEYSDRGPGPAETPDLSQQISLRAQASLTFTCLLFCIPGSIFPILNLIGWAAEKIKFVSLHSLSSDTFSSLVTSLGVVLSCLLLAVLWIFWSYTDSIKLSRVRLLSGALVPFLMPSQALAYLSFQLTKIFGENVQNTVLTNSRLTLIFTLSLKFFALIALPLMDSLLRYPRQPLEIAKTLGLSRMQIIFQILVRSFRPALVLGALLIFVMTMGEIELSLLLQPYGYHSIAQHVFSYSNLGLVREASVWILCSIGLSVFPLYLILDRIEQGERVV